MKKAIKILAILGLLVALVFVAVASADGDEDLVININHQPTSISSVGEIEKDDGGGITKESSPPGAVGETKKSDGFQK